MRAGILLLVLVMTVMTVHTRRPHGRNGRSSVADKDGKVGGGDDANDGQICKDKYIKFGGDHTMCKYKTGQCKYELLSKKLPGKKKILGYHNYIRQVVARDRLPGQPGASNMRELVWDKELQVVAQRWADQCDFGHDANRQIETFPDPQGGVGQNVAKYSKSEANPKVNYRKLIDGWYNESTIFPVSVIEKYQHASPYGHYSQLMWANTSRLGCGHTYFRSTREGNIWFEHYLVCNYAQAGNLIGGEVYKRGSAGSKCEFGKSKYKGLCA